MIQVVLTQPVIYCQLVCKHYCVNDDQIHILYLIMVSILCFCEFQQQQLAWHDSLFVKLKQHHKEHASAK